MQACPSTAMAVVPLLTVKMEYIDSNDFLEPMVFEVGLGDSRHKGRAYYIEDPMEDEV